MSEETMSEEGGPLNDFTAWRQRELNPAISPKRSSVDLQSLHSDRSNESSTTSIPRDTKQCKPLRGAACLLMTKRYFTPGAFHFGYNLGPQGSRDGAAPLSQS